MMPDAAYRLIIGVVSTLLLLLSGPAALAEDPFQGPFVDEIEPILAQHCYRCHGDDEQKGDIDLKAFGDAAAFRDDPLMLEDLIWVLDGGLMPPQKAEQPTDAERKQVLKWAHEFLAAIDNAIPNDPGVVVMPRINHREYDYVMRDLTGRELDVGQFLTPDSGAGEGFLNVGEAHTMTVGQFEAFLSAAKKTLGHARVSPSTGPVWYQAPQPAAPDVDQLRKMLAVAWADWFDLVNSQQMEAHLAALKRETGMQFGAYLEAAWQYEHRDALGMADAAIGDVADRYEVPLNHSALHKVYAVLTRNPEVPAAVERADSGLFMQRMIERWREAPGPDGDDPYARRERFRAMEQWRDRAVDNGRWGPNRPDIEVQPPTKADRQAEWGATEDGRQPYVIDLTQVTDGRIYLVLGDGTDGNEDDFAIWTGGKVDGRPWQEVCRVPRSLAGPDAAFGRDGTGEAIDSGAIGVRAPSVVELEVPTDAERLTLTLALDPQRGRNASVAGMIRDTPPDLPLGHLEARRILGSKVSDRAKRLLRAKNELGYFTNTAGFATGIDDDQVAADLPENLRQLYGIRESEERWGTWRFALTPTAADVLRRASDEQKQELQVIRAQMEDMAQPAQRELASWMREHGHPDFREGQLPTDDQLAALEEAERAKVQPLIDAAEEELSEQAEAARRILGHFARRAWRQPVAPAVVDDLVELYRDERTQGRSFDSAIKAPMAAVLVSPQFLYRFSESDQSGEPYRLSDYELAERLSFMVWASVPDAELLALAEQGRLQDPAVVKQQLRRMLADPRSRALAQEFAGQWLQFADFKEKAAPDAEMFPKFDAELKQAMDEEVTLFFVDLFRENRSILNVIDADYTFANERLADHYGLAGVKGERMRRVELPDDAHRGGVLTMASVLTKYSKSLRPSPIHRGVWVHEYVLGVPLPEPPPDVPILSDEERDEEGKSIREQLAAHRSDPACYPCHQRFDPFGLAMQNFDAIGRWRENDQAGEPIDAVGVFDHTGERLDGVEGLKQHLKNNRAQFVRNFCKKLLGYALGRVVRPTDQPLIDQMSEALAKHDYRPATVLEMVVTSQQFRFRRDENPGQ